MTISVYLDTRFTQGGDKSPAPVKFAIRKDCRSAFLMTDIRILPSQWDKVRGEVIKHPNAKMMNMILAKKRIAIDTTVLRLMDSGELSKMSAIEVRDKILEAIDPDARKKKQAPNLFAARFTRFMNLKDNEGTRGLYGGTLRKLSAYDPKLPERTFEEITKDYLLSFEAYCAKTQKKNGRNIHLRNIRAVFNDAIDAGITTAYPFRTYHLKQEPTRKKALTPEQLRTLMTTECEPYQEPYRDMFVLMFLLRGINIGDLLLAEESAIVNGRFEYRRNKTGALFSIKIEPETKELLTRYKGETHLLNPLDTYSYYKDYLHHLNDALKEIGRPLDTRGRATGAGIFPELSSNWARHTWATTAIKIGISKEVISKALGHSFGLRVTDIYIDFDMGLVDDANRKVIDYIFYGKDYHQND